MHGRKSISNEKDGSTVLFCTHFSLRHTLKVRIIPQNPKQERKYDDGFKVLEFLLRLRRSVRGM